MKRAAVSVALLLACAAGSALALDRNGAIEAAKREVKAKCTSKTFCTFNARAERDKWFVRVDFSDGAHAIFILDQTGKVVGRVE